MNGKISDEEESLQNHAATMIQRTFRHYIIGVSQRATHSM